MNTIHACPRCGYKDSGNYCSSCGFKFDNNPNTEVEVAYKSKEKPISLANILLSAIRIPLESVLSYGSCVVELLRPGRLSKEIASDELDTSSLMNFILGSILISTLTGSLLFNDNNNGFTNISVVDDILTTIILLFTSLPTAISVYLMLKIIQVNTKFRHIWLAFIFVFTAFNPVIVALQEKYGLSVTIFSGSITTLYLSMLISKVNRIHFIRAFSAVYLAGDLVGILFILIAGIASRFL